MNVNLSRSMFCPTPEKTGVFLVASITHRFSLRVTRSRILAGLAIAAAALCDSTPAAAQMIGYPIQDTWTLAFNATGTDELHDHANNVRSLYFDVDDGTGTSTTVKKAFLSFQANKDFAPYPYYHGTIASTGWSSSSGATWAAPYETPNVDMMSAIKRIDGTVVAVPFRPLYPASMPNTTFTFTYHTSTNNGTSWTTHLDTAADCGVASFGSQLSHALRFHRGVIQESNGDLYATAYAAFEPQDRDTSYTPNKFRFRVVLMKSTNGGQRWTFQNTVAAGAAGHKYSESALARGMNGDWLCVMRHDDMADQPLQMVQRRSTNNGVSWTGTGPINTPGLTADGVDPTLMLMTNGIMVLSYGRQNAGTAGRNTRLAFSTDGNGTTWSNIVETFTAVDGSNESTGYTALIPVNAHRFIQVTDTGISWSYSSQWPGGGNPYQLKQKLVDIVLTRRNRLDLKTRLNPATDITTDLTYSNALHPEARITAPFDGSVDYWSGAFKNGTSGSYTVDLGEVYSIDTIGVCLQANVAQSATVQFSTNGSTWTTKKTYDVAVPSASKHTTVNFTSLTPADARYVRVNITATAGSMICLNELEIYTVNDTYENAIPGVLPYNYTSIGGSWIREGVPPLPNGYKSKRGLYLVDGDSADKGVTKTTTATTAKTLEFRIKPVAYAASNGALQFRLNSGATIAFRLRVTSGGAISWYNGSTYTTVAGASAPTGAWTKIKVVATATGDTASLYVNDVLKGTLNGIGCENPVTTMNSVTFGSGGGAAIGDEAYLDDVYLTP